MEITDKDKKNLKEVAERYRLKLILLHGSYSKGEEIEGESDLDIAVLAKKTLDLDELLDLSSDISGILGNSSDRELDLKTLNRKDPLFLYEVIKNSVLLYGDETDYDEFCAYAFKYYYDASKLFELENTLLQKKREKLLNKYA